MIARTMYLIVIAMAATFWVHNQITKQIVENEFHAIKIFRHYKISLDFLKIGIVGTIATVVAVPLVDLFSLQDVFSPIFDVLLISFVFFVSLVLMTSFFQLTLPRLKPHKKARLCFRITKHTLEEAIRKDEEQRQQTVIKYIKYLKKGLESFNKYLYKTHGFEITNIDTYFNAAHKTLLIGSDKEIEKVAENINSAWNSIGEKEKEDSLHGFFAALQRLRGKKSKKAVSTAELMKMTRTLSWIDKAKAKMTSPYILPLITAIISLVLTILNVWKGIVELL